MLYHLRGELIERQTNFVAIDVGGVGYALTVSLNTSDALTDSLGKTVRLYTHLQVREDGVELFGFYSREELSCFKMLTSVSGVGPKAAIAILSILSPDRFAYAVCGEDVKAISAASGVGAKTAARIVLELKDKLLKDTKTALESGKTPMAATAAPQRGGDSRKLSEATDALTVLGYSRGEIVDILRTLDIASMSLEEIITAALKRFAKN